MKKQYSNTELSDKLCANPSCRKPLKKRLEHLDYCYSCLRIRKQSKKRYTQLQVEKRPYDQKSKSTDLAKHFEIVKQNSNLKYTIKLKTVKAVNVFKYVFKTIPNVKLNGNYSLNISDYNTFLINLQYWQ